MKISRTTALAALAVVSIGVASTWGAGLWSTLPIVGQSSFCASVLGTGNVQGGTTGQGTGTTIGGQVICAQTVPAGPTTLTGNEGVPADLNIGSTTNAQAYGSQPQTVLVPTGTLAAFAAPAGSPRNFIRNGDISVNPFQRGTAENTAPWGEVKSTAYTADGFSMQYGSGNGDIFWSKQTGTADINPPQFTASLRMRRDPISTDNAQICQHAVLTSQNSQALVGQKVVYSFWAKVGTGFSGASSAFTATVGFGTGTDQSPTTFQAGTWTNQGTAVTSTLTGSSTWTQYSITGTIPTTNSSTAVNQVGTDICYTPSVGPGATDFIETSNHQLEIVYGQNTTPSAFEHHNAQQDLAVAQAYFFQLKESGTVGTPVGVCYGTATFICNVNLPVQLRQSTTGQTDGGVNIAAASVTPVTAGSFKLAGGGGAMSTITSPVATNSSSSLLQFTITNADGGAQAPTTQPLLSGGSTGGTSGLLAISAEL